MSTTIFYPLHYRVIKREGTKWAVKGSKLVSANNDPIGCDDIQSYGITALDLVVSLFRINGGKPGYYIANLRDKNYYYCGLSLEDVQIAFRNLGIGREDPRKAIGG